MKNGRRRTGTKHRIVFLFLLLAVSVSSCSWLRRHKQIDFPAYTFTVDTIYPTTGVKHQGKSSNCWAYAVASLFETEALVQNNDSVSLSPEYIVRHKYLAQFDHYCHTDGKEKICKGGLGHTFIRTFRTAGLLPRQEYDSCYLHRPDYSDLLKRIRRLAEKVVDNQSEKESIHSQLLALLDNQMGAVPDSFSYRGRMVTPHSFAQQFPSANKEYIELTSFSNHPYHAYCQLDLPDNWEHLPFYNIPLNQLIEVMVNALQHGTTFAWDGDVSESSFSARKGIAFCTPEMQFSEQARLDAFLSEETTDDHMMHIVGLAHNQAGERFFIAKNSSGVIGPHKGFVYLSENYVRLKTISILIDKAYLQTFSRTESFANPGRRTGDCLAMKVG